MELRPSLQIQTVIKALTDVILPAVDPTNSLAQEQTRLAIAMLGLVAKRLPLGYRYDREDLSGFLGLAGTLSDLATKLPGDAASLSALNDGIATGADVLERARAEPSELEAANFVLRERIGALVTALYAASDTDVLKAVSAAVMAHARDQLLRERAWLAPQGWEPDPSALPPIETLLDGPGKADWTRDPLYLSKVKNSASSSPTSARISRTIGAPKE